MTFKIVAISDTHEQEQKVILPEGDVLVHTGDITYKGAISAIAKFSAWLKEQKPRFKEIVVIAGNHDFCFQNQNHDVAANLIRESGAHYLQDSGVEIEGRLFWGSPWQPWFYDWAFNLQRGPALARKWAMIPEETQVLLTHGPPMGVLDLVDRDWGGTEHVGCQDLSDRIAQLADLKLHVFGHLHKQGGNTAKLGNVIYANAAVCNEKYIPANNILEIEL